MVLSTSQRSCGFLGLLAILIGMTVGYLGVPLFDWLFLAVGASLLTFAIFTGDRMILFDGNHRSP